MTIPEYAAVGGFFLIAFRFFDGFATKKEGRETRDNVQKLLTSSRDAEAGIHGARLQVAENTTLTKQIKEQVERTNGRVTVLEEWRAAVESKPKRKGR